MIKIITLVLFIWPYTSPAQHLTDPIFSNKKGWGQISQDAKDNQKYILVYTYKPSYEPCTYTEKLVFTAPKVESLLKAKFIVVKLPIDSNGQDPNNLRSWYSAELKINDNAQLRNVLSYLFYSPDGRLVYKSEGEKDPEQFLDLLKYAVEPSRLTFDADLKAYKEGKKIYQKMPDLARTVRELMSNEEFSFSIAKDYKDNFLNKLSKKVALKREYLSFVQSYAPRILNVNDIYLKTAYANPEILDSYWGKGVSEQYLKAVLIRDIVDPMLYANKMPIVKQPNWSKIEDYLAERYSKLNFDYEIRDQKIQFYRLIQDWELFSRYKDQQVKTYPSTNPFFELNAPAWDVFVNCTESQILQRALGWSELSLKIDSTNVQYLDTKANILYKLGRKKEAIDLEKSAIEAAYKFAPRDVAGNPYYIKEMKITIEKMEGDQPTWF